MRKAFTLLEILVVIGIAVTIISVTAAYLRGSRSSASLNSVTTEVVSLLREAQSDSMAQDGGTVWGVHFENSTTTTPFFAFFNSPTYSTSAIQGYYPLPSGVVYLTSTLASGAKLDITFSQITGAASASTTINFATSDGGITSTVSIASSGAIAY